MNREAIGINLMVAAFTIWVAWRQGWLAWLWAFVVEYVRDGQPEQRTREEYARRLDFEDGLDIAEAVAAVPELDLDGTQPFEQVFRDPPAGAPVLVPVQDAWVPVTYEPPVNITDVPRSSTVSAAEGATPANAGPGYPHTTDVPRPGPTEDPGNSTGPGYLPHAGPPAWRPRHAKTSWVDELITDALGAPTVEIYMWNWQQRHRLAITA